MCPKQNYPRNSHIEFAKDGAKPAGAVLTHFTSHLSIHLAIHRSVKCYITSPQGAKLYVDRTMVVHCEVFHAFWSNL